MTRTLSRSYDQYLRPAGYQLKTGTLNTENSAAYTYDTAGRLATVSAPAGGSPATAGFTSISVSSVSSVVPTHDSDGNLLDDAGINTGTSGDRNYLWDAENRLIEVKDESDGTTIASYAYDYLSRRVRKTVPGVDGRIDVVVGGRFDVVKSGGVWSGFSTLLS